MHDTVLHKYSLEFEGNIAEYATGNPSDRSEKTIMELYKKLEHAHMFFRFCERYFNLAGKNFIEVGCGTGIISVAAAQRGATVFATDIVEKAVGLAAKRFAEHGISPTLFASNLCDPPAADLRGRFDMVFCYQVIEHIPRHLQFAALANLFDLVAPGGFLFIDTENNLCPFDRHDTGTWLVRLLAKRHYDPIIQALGKGINFFEPTAGQRVQTRDYISYDELIGASAMKGFSVVHATMPHDSPRQYLRVRTGSDWLYDNILQYFDSERFSPISILLRRSA
jgi:2-polyprenyl-3-methyl-5-hydroxy-6-metoxy-1,4-benzoquinol methylase